MAEPTQEQAEEFQGAVIAAWNAFQQLLSASSETVVERIRSLKGSLTALEGIVESITPESDD